MKFHVMSKYHNLRLQSLKELYCTRLFIKAKINYKSGENIVCIKLMFPNILDEMKYLFMTKNIILNKILHEKYI